MQSVCNLQNSTFIFSVQLFYKQKNPAKRQDIKELTKKQSTQYNYLILLYLEDRFGLTDGAIILDNRHYEGV